MQLAIFATLAVLCSSVLAVPPQRRGDLIDVLANVENDLNDADIDVLKRSGDLVDVGVVVDNLLNDADISVL
ncbi:hypothetical protein DFH29DRAFT_1004906 [Suillus ampliporus]|nr:hypothetical protein DFH29DRAFT_1004906 [Suillus ampliporus]